MPILKHFLKAAQAFQPVPILKHLLKVARTFMSAPTFGKLREILNHEDFGASRNACVTLKGWRIGASRNACATLLAVAFALGACAHAPSAKNKTAGSAVTITRVWPDYRAAESFDRISEYFTGDENTGGQIVLRTHPEARAGYYFFTRLKVETPAAAAIADAQVEISVIMPDAPVVKTFLLRAHGVLREGVNLLNPGLTGADWPWTDTKTHPVAWRVRLLDADGAELATTQSYLWSK